MAAITICSDFRAPKINSSTVSTVPHLFAMKRWDRMPWPSFSECWALSQLFHSPLSLSSRGSLVPFTFCIKGGVICISEVIDISPGNLDSSLCFFQSSVSHDVLCTGRNIQPWHTPFPTWNQSVVPCPVLLLSGLHTDFSRGRLGGLVFPSLSEFSTVYCDPPSQRLWHSQ